MEQEVGLIGFGEAGSTFALAGDWAAAAHVYDAKTDAAEKLVLKNILNYGGFRESNNDQLVPTRQLELFKDRRKVENDEQLAAAEKTKQLAEIDKKLAALGK